MSLDFTGTEDSWVQVQVAQGLSVLHLLLLLGLLGGRVHVHGGVGQLAADPATEGLGVAELDLLSFLAGGGGGLVVEGLQEGAQARGGAPGTGGGLGTSE